jgi:UDP-N-acetylmuramoylalanine--D-glutamate ligase
VVGLGVAGEAAARRMAQRGWDVTVTEDRPSDATRARAAALQGVTVLDSPDPETVDRLVDDAEVVVPSPGVPVGHPAIARALRRGVPVWSEFELVSRWGAAPMVAVTGTNGKTTVTTLVASMLEASGLRTVAAGNNEIPLVDVVDEDLDVVVVEASSFRLEFTETFRPAVGVWLNLAEDHLDWHPSMAAYADAKAHIWQAQQAGDLAVANIDDPVVMRYARQVRSRLSTFGLDHGDWRVEAGQLAGPDGAVVPVSALWRSLPHDRTNALAACAAALAAGASVEGVRRALREFRGLPHRLVLVGDDGAVRFYDDSKATDPHAAVAAVRSFASSVLIAGGRNKGLDLSVLAQEAGRLRGVVAIGEATEEIVAAFAGVATVRTAGSMDDAVAAARSLAEPGDAVLLSPACASFDWYRSYGERGDDFARAVRALVG